MATHDFGAGHFDWRQLRASLAATLALGLALGAALASSLAAVEGNIVAAISLAAFSLLLAAVIALTVVPRLFRRARREWLRFSFQIAREGRIFLCTLAVVAVAAFNTGNNLIFIILSAALALLAVSEALSHWNLRQLSAEVDLPDCVPAGQPFVSVFSLYNQRAWVPAFSCTLTCLLDRVLEPSTSSRPLTQTSAALLQSAYFTFLPGRGRFRQSLWLQLPQRGLYRLSRLETSTQFPFGFVKKQRRLPGGVSLTVLPEVEPPNEFFEMLPLLNGAFESYYKGSGSDLHSIRDYHSQDSGRFLDWKASAKTGQLMVREFTKEDDRKCCFVFDNTASDFQERERPAFEKAVRLCASALRHFQEMGCETRLVTPLRSTRYALSESALLENLKILAVIEPQSIAAVDLLTLASETSFKIVFTAGRRGEVPTVVWTSAHVVFWREL
jgi:uncharacterized protein (DUF58 family)